MGIFFCSFPLVFPRCKLLSYTNLDIYRASKISGKEEKLKAKEKSKDMAAMWETWVQSLGWEDPLEEVMAIHSSILGLLWWLRQ